MTAATMTLADFLLARIAEDEAVARSTQASYEPLEWTDEGMPDAVGLAGPVDGPSGYTSVVIDPVRVLAECAAKRAIVECHEGWHECVYSTDNGANRGLTDFDAGGEVDGMRPCQTVQHLAAVYADHPDYRDEWSTEAIT